MDRLACYLRWYCDDVLLEVVSQRANFFGYNSSVFGYRIFFSKKSVRAFTARCFMLERMAPFYDA